MKSGSAWLALLISVPVAAAVWFATTNRDDRRSSNQLRPIMTSRQFIQLIPVDNVLKSGWNNGAVRPDLASVSEGPERENARVYLETMDAKIAIALSRSSTVQVSRERGEHLTLRTVLQKFSDQTANRFDLRETLVGDTVVVDEQARPFWPAVDAIAEQAGLIVDASLYLDDRPTEMFDGIHFRDRTADDDSLSIAYAGPFRIVAGPAIREPDGVDGQFVRVPLQIHAEPRLIPMRLTWSDVAVTVARDGDTLPLATTLLRTVSPERLEHHVLMTELVCRDVPRRSQTLTLSASFLVALDVRTNVFVGNLSSPTGFRASTRLGYTAKPLSIRTSASETLEIELSIERGNVALPGPLQFHNAEVTYDRRTEAGATEEVVVRSDVPTYRTIYDDRGIVAYRFTGVPADANLQTIRGNIAHAVVDVPVAFTIVDLPIENASLAPLNAGSGGGL